MAGIRPPITKCDPKVGTGESIDQMLAGNWKIVLAIFEKLDELAALHHALQNLEHNSLKNRDALDAHPMASITGLVTELSAIRLLIAETIENHINSVDPHSQYIDKQSITSLLGSDLTKVMSQEGVSTAIAAVRSELADAVLGIQNQLPNYLSKDALTQEFGVSTDLIVSQAAVTAALATKANNTITISGTNGIKGAGTLTGDIVLSPEYGSTANTVAQGNDPRIVNALQNSEKGVAGGLATLGLDGKIPLSQLNETLLGSVRYEGAWSAATNTPPLDAVPSEKGIYYIATDSGQQFGLDFNAGDWVISDGSKWDKVDNTDQVWSVNGRKGAVTGLAESTDPRFTDKRDWIAGTVSQADAEAGTSTNRFAFTPLRVKQAFASFFAKQTTAWSRGLLTQASDGSARDYLNVPSVAVTDKLRSDFDSLKSGVDSSEERYLNLISNSGRFTTSDSPFANLSISGRAFKFNTIFWDTIRNRGSARSSGYFFYNNTTNGGTAGELSESVISLLAVLGIPTARYGIEYHVAEITQGGGIDLPLNPASADGIPRYLAFTNSATLLGRDLRFCGYFRVKQGSILFRYGDPHKVYTPADGWFYIDFAVANTSGYNNSFPGVYAELNAVFEMAMPCVYLGAKKKLQHYQIAPSTLIPIDAKADRSELGDAAFLPTAHRSEVVEDKVVKSGYVGLGFWRDIRNSVETTATTPSQLLRMGTRWGFSAGAALNIPNAVNNDYGTLSIYAQYGDTSGIRSFSRQFSSVNSGLWVQWGNTSGDTFTPWYRIFTSRDTLDIGATFQTARNALRISLLGTSEKVLTEGYAGLGGPMQSINLPSPVNTAQPTGFYYQVGNEGGSFFLDVSYSTPGYAGWRLSNRPYSDDFWLHYSAGSGQKVYAPPVKIWHSGNTINLGKTLTSAHNALGVGSPDGIASLKGGVLADAQVPEYLKNGVKKVAGDYTASMVNTYSGNVQDAIKSRAVTVMTVAEIRAVDYRDTQFINLSDKNLGGLFVWDGSDLSVKVAADLASKNYIAPTGQNGSGGAWVRANSTDNFQIGVVPDDYIGGPVRLLVDGQLSDVDFVVTNNYVPSAGDTVIYSGHYIIDSISGTQPLMENFCKYYGYLRAVNGYWNVEEAAQYFARFDGCVFGDNYQMPTHPEYEYTQAIIARIREIRPSIKIFGYVPIGLDAAWDDSSLPLEEIESRILNWKLVGATHIFLDEYGYDYFVDRTRQNHCVKFCHDNGMFVCANSWSAAYCFSNQNIIIGWEDPPFEGNPTNLPSLLTENDYLQFENVVYNYRHEPGTSVGKNPPQYVKDRTRLNDMYEYMYTPRPEFDGKTFYEQYGTKGYALDAIMKRDQQMYNESHLIALALGMHAHAASVAGWGASDSNYNWYDPPKLRATSRAAIQKAQQISYAGLWGAKYVTQIGSDKIEIYWAQREKEVLFNENSVPDKSQDKKHIIEVTIAKDAVINGAPSTYFTMTLGDNTKEDLKVSIPMFAGITRTEIITLLQEYRYSNYFLDVYDVIPVADGVRFASKEPRTETWPTWWVWVSTGVITPSPNKFTVVQVGVNSSDDQLREVVLNGTAVSTGSGAYWRRPRHVPNEYMYKDETNDRNIWFRNGRWFDFQGEDAEIIRTYYSDKNVSPFAQQILGTMSSEELMSLIGFDMTGSIVLFGTDTPPEGFIVADGVPASRAEYPKLFAKFGTKYGEGDGVTTFGIPDLRDRFPKGALNVAEVGAYAEDSTRKHTHTATISTESHTHDFSGTTSSDGEHTHGTPLSGSPAWGSAGSTPWGTSNTANRAPETSSAGSHTHTVSGTTAAHSHTHTIAISETGGTDTRPRSFAGLYCIKT